MGAGFYRDGMTRLMAGDVAEGLRLLEAALREAPDDAKVMHGLARALEASGERERSMELLTRVHEGAPAEPDPACDLALSLIERGDDERASRVLSPVLEAQPEHPRANFYMAMALAKTDAARARRHTVHARKSPDPDDRQAAAALDRVLALYVDR
ncbi:tetratricopeptide repeat protein [Myxococcus stipitatus]|uniref:tetratricopeptide repeat protein n=1 Tax=Myxococcus stipitatus TaxID=83455 RepID=UPI001F294E42|nr:tetratricopeptide repeat protein [Myxococcus stipitatus]MCE9670402.1 tetratricopeptide repeat protein [Myxococcus stipitatus]